MESEKHAASAESSPSVPPIGACDEQLAVKGNGHAKPSDSTPEEPEEPAATTTPAPIEPPADKPLTPAPAPDTAQPRTTGTASADPPPAAAEVRRCGRCVGQSVGRSLGRSFGRPGGLSVEWSSVWSDDGPSVQQTPYPKP